MELINKSRKKGIEDFDVSRILDGLKEQGLQSDERFAIEFLHSKAEAGFGPSRIRRDLSSRGVGKELINLVFQESEVDWLANAKKVFERKFPEQSSELKEYAKRVRFLNYRGFEQDDIKKVVGELNAR
ncbi:MAG: regulatory protein RecX [Pseudomonadota bacterium]|nr:regulatory protein RecX [Pseudomonadota bacterium]